jgi:transcriptional regulator with XRE-family HTH domain
MRLTELRLRRFERGLMQIELARRTGIAWFRLSKIENGQVVAQPDELHRISTVLNIPTDQLGVEAQTAPSA